MKLQLIYNYYSYFWRNQYIWKGALYFEIPIVDCGLNNSECRIIEDVMRLPCVRGLRSEAKK